MLESLSWESCQFGNRIRSFFFLVAFLVRIHPPFLVSCDVWGSSHIFSVSILFHEIKNQICVLFVFYKVIMHVSICLLSSRPLWHLSVLHKRFYPCAFQQNEAIKQKNRHILETLSCFSLVLGWCSTYCVLSHQSHAFIHLET